MPDLQPFLMYTAITVVHATSLSQPGRGRDLPEERAVEGHKLTRHVTVLLEVDKSNN